MIGRLNHVAIAVKDLNAAASVYRKTLGAEVSAAVPQPDHGVTTIFITLPNTKIELLEPLGANSPRSIHASRALRGIADLDIGMMARSFLVRARHVCAKFFFFARFHQIDRAAGDTRYLQLLGMSGQVVRGCHDNVIVWLPIGRHTVEIQRAFVAFQRGIEPRPTAACDCGVAVISTLRSLVTRQVYRATVGQGQYLVAKVSALTRGIVVLVETIVHSAGQSGRRYELRGLGAAHGIAHVHLV